MTPQKALIANSYVYLLFDTFGSFPWGLKLVLGIGVWLLLEVIVLSRLKLAVIVQGAALNQVDQSKEGQLNKSRCEWVTEPFFLLLLFSANAAITCNQSVEAEVFRLKPAIKEAKRVVWKGIVSCCFSSAHIQTRFPKAELTVLPDA